MKNTYRWGTAKSGESAGANRTKWLVAFGAFEQNTVSLFKNWSVTNYFVQSDTLFCPSCSRIEKGEESGAIWRNVVTKGEIICTWPIIWGLYLIGEKQERIREPSWGLFCISAARADGWLPRSLAAGEGLHEKIKEISARIAVFRSCCGLPAVAKSGQNKRIYMVGNPESAVLNWN